MIEVQRDTVLEVRRESVVPVDRVVPFPRKQLDYLQIVRGFAALLVCFFHARILLNGSTSYGDLLFGRGDIGVPIFFLISGFIIAYTSQGIIGVARINSYFFKRYLRVAPLYFICTAVFIVLEDKIALYAGEKFGEIIRMVFFLPSTDTYPPLFVGWTLIFEMFFYIFFGCCLFFGKRKYVVFFTGVIFCVFILPAVNGIPLFSGEWYRFEPFYSYLNVISSPLVMQFALGVLLFLVVPKLTIQRKYIILLNAVVFVGFCMYYFLIPKSDLLDMLFCGGLVAGILLLDFSGTFLHVPRFLTYLGDISYSLYLTHSFVLLAWTKASGRLNILANLPNVLAFVLIIGLMMLVGAFAYEFVEKKIAQALKPLTVTKKGS